MWWHIGCTVVWVTEYADVVVVVLVDGCFDIDWAHRLFVEVGFHHFLSVLERRHLVFSHRMMTLDPVIRHVVFFFNPSPPAPPTHDTTLTQHVVLPPSPEFPDGPALNGLAFRFSFFFVLAMITSNVCQENACLVGQGQSVCFVRGHTDGGEKDGEMHVAERGKVALLFGICKWTANRALCVLCL